MSVNQILPRGTFLPIFVELAAGTARSRRASHSIGRAFAEPVASTEIDAEGDIDLPGSKPCYSEGKR